MPTSLHQGNLLDLDDVDAIVNTVNCVGVMGKGIALQFKHKWPANFRAYEAACKAGEVRPGRRCDGWASTRLPYRRWVAAMAG